MISRTHPNLVRKLLEIEIPEITEGTVMVHKIARDPGVRCKITVSSTDPKIDPIGSCVGQKGVRVQSVMDEIAGERIDVLIHTDDNEQLLRSALAPAQINVVKFLEDNRVEAYVEEDQRPLAIGRKGQNVRLASKLLDMELDIKNFDDLSSEEKQEFLDKKATEEAKANDQAEVETSKESESDVDGLAIDQQYKDALLEANLNQSMQLKGLSIADLQTIEGIDETGAEQIFKAIN